MNVPETSHEAFSSLKYKDIAEIYRLIIEALKILGQGSSEQIARHLTIEPAKVWKRMSELERDQKIYNTKLKTKNKSGRNAFMYSLCGTGQKEQAVEVNYKKEKQTVGSIANDIIKKTGVQSSLFQ